MPTLPFLCSVAAAAISEQYPWLEDTGVIEKLLPKKDAVVLGKM